MAESLPFDLQELLDKTRQELQAKIAYWNEREAHFLTLPQNLPENESVQTFSVKKPPVYKVPADVSPEIHPFAELDQDPEGEHRYLRTVKSTLELFLRQYPLGHALALPLADILLKIDRGLDAYAAQLPPVYMHKEPADG